MCYVTGMFIDEPCHIGRIVFSSRTLVKFGVLSDMTYL